MSAPQPPVPPQWTPGQPPPVPQAPWAQPAGAPQAPVPPVAPHIGPYAPTTPYAAPYTPPVSPQFGGALTAPAVRRSPLLGIIAVIAAGIASLTPVVAAVAAFQIGLSLGKEAALRPDTSNWDWSILTPVRDWVLAAEVSFWIGTALGVWALIQGIVAIVSRRGRIAGIVAVALAIIAPVVFGVAVWLSLAAGIGAGSSIGG